MYVIEIAAGRWLGYGMDFVSTLRDAIKYPTQEAAERDNVIGTVVKVVPVYLDEIPIG